MLDVLTPLDRLHRINFAIDSTADFEAGEWVQVTGTGGVEVISGAVAATAYAVFQDTEGRWDRSFTDQATVVFGTYIADTDQYNDADNFAVGTPLTVVDGLLEEADEGDLVIGSVIVSPGNNDSLLRYTTERLNQYYIN